MLKRLLPILAILFLSIHLNGQESVREDEFKVSLITCYPGDKVYELYGHSAIRIQYGAMDNVYNFGIFSFDKPNFIYRFVKGETDYILGRYPFEYFLPEYVARNSKVVEQILNLSQEQSFALYSDLEFLALPENREYRYNYVLDNCATRPRDMIEKTVGGISYPQPNDSTLTFRNMMQDYSRNYPWYQFGIDLALGSGIDYVLTARQQMFAPVYLMQAFDKATFLDKNGNQKKLVNEQKILYEGSESAILPPTPWYFHPVFVSAIFLVFTLFVTYKDYRRLKVSKWFDSLWFFMSGLTGSLLFFLVFFSSHEATSPNYLLIWLNPLCFIASFFIFIKRCKKLLYVYHFINFALVLILLVFWWAIPQEANLAFFLLMSCTILRSANFILIHNACAKKDK